MRWRSVDLVKGQLAVIESAEQTAGGIRDKEPKSGKPRTVALGVTVVEKLRAHRLQQAQELLRVGVRLSDDTLLVSQADGTALQPRSLTHEWVRLLGKTALPRVRFHDLRHAHATHLLASGVHPKVASERLGHSKVVASLSTFTATFCRECRTTLPRWLTPRCEPLKTAAAMELGSKMVANDRLGPFGFSRKPNDFNDRKGGRVV